MLAKVSLTRSRDFAKQKRKHRLYRGKIPNGLSILVIVDYFSRFVKIEFMTSTSTGLTIKRLQRIFSRFGVPKSIRAHNGPQFRSTEFKEFCTNHAIELQYSKSYWPQAKSKDEIRPKRNDYAYSLQFRKKIVGRIVRIFTDVSRYPIPLPLLNNG